ncbi:peptide chain release factor 1, putative [Eimeria tenella]|uniref:Peptide chain release factor 1, putative n=1 Tax=Eimeria tenella TaxID=5802 RepID=U6KPX0_EIMTE|nr:peptide chain release factor 1, putative [Eimeria tenella]CDJ38943.1 peptide chain release factor 1, putative [Eimeria tenella]|eukprot:XP_013229698.1 peptide chain release factor 1, putative [Eimeria tenella]
MKGCSEKFWGRLLHYGQPTGGRCQQRAGATAIGDRSCSNNHSNLTSAREHLYLRSGSTNSCCSWVSPKCFSWRPLPRKLTALRSPASRWWDVAAATPTEPADLNCFFCTRATAFEGKCYKLTLEEPQRLVMERVALLLQRQQQEQIGQQQQQQKQSSGLEALLPLSMPPLLSRFLSTRDDIKTLRSLLIEQQQGHSSNSARNCEESTDTDLVELQHEEDALAADLAELLLQHADSIAAAAKNGQQPAKRRPGGQAGDEEEVVLEVLAGVGGEEAAQFAGELFGMYEALAAAKGWSFESLEKHKSAEGGGLRRARAVVTGCGVSELLPLEAGVHRVQRVPSTDAKKRLQTSTAAVTVLPCVSEAEVDMSSCNIRIENMRASGPGGQSVNKSETAVRATHIPTGLSVCMQETSSQADNRKRALLLLRHMLQQRMQQQHQQELHAAAGAQMGSKDRSEKIRTYNFPSDCVRDHRCSEAVPGVRQFLETAEGLPLLLRQLHAKRQQHLLAQAVEAMQLLLQQHHVPKFPSA